MSASLTFNAAPSTTSSWGHPLSSALQGCPGEVTLGLGCSGWRMGVMLDIQWCQEGLCDLRDRRVLDVRASSATLAGHLRLLSTWPQPAFLNLPAGFLHTDWPRGRLSAWEPVPVSVFSLASVHTHHTVLTSAGVLSFCSQPNSTLPVLRSPELIHLALSHSIF